MSRAPSKRKALPQDVRRRILHEAGYMCGNPVCRTIVTLDIHHLVPVSDSGNNEPENLLVLCPNCHALHHRGGVPVESLRTWKMLLLALNEAFDRHSVDLLLALDITGIVYVSGEGVLECASLIAAGLVERLPVNRGPAQPLPDIVATLRRHNLPSAGVAAQSWRSPRSFEQECRRATPGGRGRGDDRSAA
jgi:hypothetical protein